MRWCFPGIVVLSIVWSLLGFACFDGTNDPNAVPIEDAIESHSDLKRVEAFGRPAHFVGKHFRLHLIDVMSPDDFDQSILISANSDRNIRVAASADGQSVVYSDGSTFYRVTTGGKRTKLAALPDLDANGNAITDLVTWYLGVSPDEGTLYFQLDGDGRGTLCRLRLGSKKVDTLMLKHGFGLDVDLGDGTLYEVEPGSRTLWQRRFEGRDKPFKLSRDYGACRVSPDRKVILLSDGDLEASPRIGLLNLETGEERTLDFNGSNAVWGDDSTIYFLRGENALWRYERDKKKPVLFFQLRGRPTGDSGSYAAEPEVSWDRSFMSWCWTVAGKRGPRHGTVLFDLKRGEYKVLYREIPAQPIPEWTWWHNSQWMK